METILAPAAAAGTALVGPLAARAHRARSSPIVRMRCRIHALGLRASACSLSGRSFATPRLNRPSKLVLSASLEDTASVEVGQSDTPSLDAADGSESAQESTAEASQALDELDEQTQKSKAVLDDVVNNLKDVLKVQDQVNADKAMGVLKDTTDQLKEQAEKARAVLMATAQETAERSKENLTMLAENSSDPLLKDIAQTALNAHFPEETKSAARIHDFCLGIPYGGLLLASGLIWFLFTGSTAALRFGVFLGGIILALSITSLKVWKRGESSIPFIKAQAATAAILAIRELRKFVEVKKFFPHAVMALLSLSMLGFYGYVFLSGGNPPKKSKEAQAA